MFSGFKSRNFLCRHVVIRECHTWSLIFRALHWVTVWFIGPYPLCSVMPSTHSLSWSIRIANVWRQVNLHYLLIVQRGPPAVTGQKLVVRAGYRDIERKGLLTRTRFVSFIYDTWLLGAFNLKHHKVDGTLPDFSQAFRIARLASIHGTQWAKVLGRWLTHNQAAYVIWTVVA